jgi:hypothetical protein
MTDWPVLRLEEDNDRLRAQVARLTAALAEAEQENAELASSDVVQDVVRLTAALRAVMEYGRCRPNCTFNQYTAQPEDCDCGFLTAYYAARALVAVPAVPDTCLHARRTQSVSDPDRFRCLDCGALFVPAVPEKDTP